MLFPNTSLTLSQYAMSLAGSDDTTSDGSESSVVVSSDSGLETGTTTATGTGVIAVGSQTGASSSTAQCDALSGSPVTDTTTVPIALGVALGVCLLILSGILVWQWRRARQLQQELRDVKLAATTNTLGFPHDKPAAGGWDGQGHGATMGWSAGNGWAPLPSSNLSDVRSELGEDERRRVRELPVEDRRGELQG